MQETPNHNLNTYQQGEQDWTHSDDMRRSTHASSCVRPSPTDRPLPGWHEVHRRRSREWRRRETFHLSCRNRRLGYRPIRAPEVTTEQVNNTIHAANRDGANGREQIQNALDAAKASSGLSGVVIDGTNPDDLSGKSHAKYDAGWLLDQPPLIPSDTVVTIDGYLFVDDGVDDNILRNENADSGDSTRDENIHIRGNGTVDGNGQGQTDSLASDRWKECGILLSKVDRFSITGALTVRNTNSWAVVPEDASDGQIDVIFDLDGNSDNQDGTHVVGPADNITVSQVTGTIGDDACVANARSDPVQGIGGGGDVTGIVFSGVTVTNVYKGGILRTAASTSYTLDGVKLTNGLWINDGVASNPAINIGGGGSPSADNHKNIRVDGLTVKTLTGSPAVLYRQFSDAKAVEISGVQSANATSLFDNNGNGISQFTFSECNVVLADGETESDGMIRFRNSTSFGEISIDNVTLRADNSVDTRAIRFANYGSANGIDISMRLVLFDTGVQMGAPNDTAERVHFDNVTMRAVNTEWDVPDGVSMNGIAEESANAEEPQGTYDVGTVVNFTDTGDDSGTGVYKPSVFG